MMTFNAVRGWAMNVMDGRRCVAKARKTSAGWLLHLTAASWLDARARKPSRVTNKIDPGYLLVKTRHEAVLILIQLTNTGRK